MIDKINAGAGLDEALYQEVSSSYLVGQKMWVDELRVEYLFIVNKKTEEVGSVFGTVFVPGISRRFAYSGGEGWLE